MKKFEVRVGGFYVNQRKDLVREITNNDWAGKVHWRSYYLRTGEATGDFLMCSPEHILKWADREASLEEVSRLKRLDAAAKESARAIEWAEIVLKNMPDDRLFAEVRRRGHRVI